MDEHQQGGIFSFYLPPRRGSRSAVVCDTAVSHTQTARRHHKPRRGLLPPACPPGARCLCSCLRTVPERRHSALTTPAAARHRARRDASQGPRKRRAPQVTAVTRTRGVTE